MSPEHDPLPSLSSPRRNLYIPMLISSKPPDRLPHCREPCTKAPRLAWNRICTPHAGAFSCEPSRTGWDLRTELYPPRFWCRHTMHGPCFALDAVMQYPAGAAMRFCAPTAAAPSARGRSRVWRRAQPDLRACRTAFCPCTRPVPTLLYHV